MISSSPNWHRIEPPATYVQSYGDHFTGFRSDSVYAVAALRRVTHPSLRTVVKRAVDAAASTEGPSLPVSREVLEAAMTLPSQSRRGLASQRPKALIPFLKVAGEALAPLQLIGDVPCIRLYRLDVPGALAQKMYGAGLERGEAPEAALTPEVVDQPDLSVCYLDVLYDPHERRWPPSPLVLISNAKVEPRGYVDMTTKGVSRMAELLVRMPELPLQELPSLAEVPDSHADWGTALILQAALGQRSR